MLVSVVLLVIIIVVESMKDVQLAKLELDCVEEKRRITDPLCVKYNVGFNMDTKTKYKILAQAEPEEINEYISLLWKDNSAPNTIKKYYARKRLMLAYNKEMLTLNRECQGMFKNGENPNTISKYYIAKKKELQAEHNQKIKRMKSIAIARREAESIE